MKKNRTACLENKMYEPLRMGKHQLLWQREDIFAKFRTHLKITGSKFRTELKNELTLHLAFVKKNSKILIKGKKIYSLSNPRSWELFSNKFFIGSIDWPALRKETSFF